MTQLRKAAILISALDARTADCLLDQLTDQEALIVRNAVMDLTDVSQQEEQRVLSEFLGRQEEPTSQPSDDQPDDAQPDETDELFLSAEFLAEADPPPSAGPEPRHLPPQHDDFPHTSSRSSIGAEVSDRERRPFAFLREARATALLQLLKQETPQTIAVVVSHMPPDTAAEFFQALPADVLGPVLRRVAEIQDMAPEILAEVEQEIEARFRREFSFGDRPGVTTLSAILRAANPRTQATILSEIASENEALAEALFVEQGTVDQDPPPSAAARDPLPSPTPLNPSPSERPSSAFSDLESLDEVMLAEVLQRADPQHSLLALAGAPPRLVKRILSHLPAREARRMEKKIRQLGPTRLKDIDHAQQHLVEIMDQLKHRNSEDSPRRGIAFAA